MTLQDLANLIQLRRYLYDIQNGYAALPKENTKGLGQKIRELDLKIVKHALEYSTEEQVSLFRSNDADFEASTLMIGKPSFTNGMVAINAPLDSDPPVVLPEVKEPADMPVQQKVGEETKSAKKAAKKGSFQRSND